MFKLRAVALGLFFVLSPVWNQQVGAVDFIVQERSRQRVLLIKDEEKSGRFPQGGMILPDDAMRLEQALREAGPITEVLFNSRGGSERDGLEIGRIIRRRGLSTRIPSNAICASACADAFLGGVARRVEPGGRYGIHMPTLVGNEKAVKHILGRILSYFDDSGRKIDLDGVRKVIQEYEKLSAQAASRWAAYVLEMGASYRIVEAGTKYSASQMNWLNQQELIDLNIVNVDN